MRVLALRMVVYGCVLVIGLLVWQSRSGGTSGVKEPKGGTVMQGTTLDAAGSPVTLITRRGRIQSIAFAPQRACADIAAQSLSPVFDERVQDFDVRGRRFRSSQSFEYHRDASGSTPMQTVIVEGELTADGSRASGTLTSSTTWWRNGVAASTCESTLVRWRVAKT